MPTYAATVVGTDISSDLAVLHIDAPASKLKPVELGDSSAMAVGDGVVAIGNPFGLDGTVTSGIVSAINREISAPDGTPIEGAIQTDAAINHGNWASTVDLAGKVVGVTSQIHSDWRQRRHRLRPSIPSRTSRQLIAKGPTARVARVTIRTSTALPWQPSRAAAAAKAGGSPVM
jgi:S1-C subfamily serine protease